VTLAFLLLIQVSRLHTTVTTYILKVVTTSNLLDK